MSISTKRGDGGETELMFGRRVAKSDQRVAAYGAVDELNAALGLARASGGMARTRDEVLPAIQRDLVALMGEVATHPEDLARYRDGGYGRITADEVERVTGEIERLEAGEGIKFRGWAMPGDAGGLAAAHLDQARVVCRRAEREVVLLGGAGGNPEILRYLNRVSDLLWLLARLEGAAGAS